MVLVLLALAVVGCRGRRPEFNHSVARDQLARAFRQPAAEIDIYEDGPGDREGEWIVSFKLQGFRPLLQARFVGRKAEWVLQDVRELPIGTGDPKWVDVGIQIGRVRRDAAQKAETTVRRMRELAEFVERFFVDQGRYPDVDLTELAQIVRAAGYTESWSHDTDAWGNRFAYHATPEGQAYIIVSSGADGKFDEDLATYFERTDTGDEAYQGTTDDPRADIIFATGTFVQAPPLGD